MGSIPSGGTMISHAKKQQQQQKDPPPATQKVISLQPSLPNFQLLQGASKNTLPSLCRLAHSIGYLEAINRQSQGIGVRETTRAAS